MSHAVLRCADPTTRPRPTPPSRRTHQCRERAGRMRTLQLRQGVTGLVGDRRNRTRRNTAEFVTPTDHRYWSTAPPAPGRIRVHLSEVEVYVGIALVDRDAA